jgi:hypothetical protein
VRHAQALTYMRQAHFTVRHLFDDQGDAMTALRVLYLLSLTVWIGSLVFFSLFVAPALFRTLPREEAGRAVAAIFPAYYAVGWGAGGLALAATLAGAAAAGLWTSAVRWRAGLLALMLAISLYAGLVVRHQVRAAKAAGDEAGLARSHKISVLLNLAVIAGGLGVVALSARDLKP